jgi:acetylornithine deacetylase/succinyl-diaminopimelate desuccinylase-like protein
VQSFNGDLVGPTGLLPDVPIRDGFPPPAAFVEIHIEQGPVLERAGARLGIVSAIAGQRRFAVTLEGSAGHAGTLPMAGRSDALCAASELVLDVERAALDVGEAVATVGQLSVDPNQTNVVPGRVTLRVDARSVEDARIDALEGGCAEPRAGSKAPVTCASRSSCSSRGPRRRWTTGCATSCATCAGVSTRTPSTW